MELGCFEPLNNQNIILDINSFGFKGLTNVKEGYFVDFCYKCEIVVDKFLKYSFTKDRISAIALE